MSAGAQSELVTSRNLFRIGEVSRLTNTKPFVLRYWETEFPMLQPVKSAKGHRLYRREDVDTVLAIKRLLYDEGFTIAGARRHLREIMGAPNGSAAAGADPSPAPPAPAPAAINRKLLLDLRDALRSFLTLLESE